MADEYGDDDFEDYDDEFEDDAEEGADRGRRAEGRGRLEIARPMEAGVAAS